MTDDKNPSPRSNVRGYDPLLEAARNVADWWHEWAEHEPDEEETAAFEMLDAAIAAKAKETGL